jgi:hypothetical protein
VEKLPYQNLFSSMVEVNLNFPPYQILLLLHEYEVGYYQILQSFFHLYILHHPLSQKIIYLSVLHAHHHYYLKYFKCQLGISTPQIMNTFSFREMSLSHRYLDQRATDCYCSFLVENIVIQSMLYYCY